MAVLDRLILRMAVCELLRDPATPPAVVINEALELARTFSTEDAVKFINGMLDGIRKKIGRRLMTSLDEQLQQRRANLDELAKLGVEIYPRRFDRTHTIAALVDALRRAVARRARGRTDPDDHERPHPRHSVVRQGELPGDLGRSGEDSGLRPPGRLAAARLSDLQAPRLRRLDRRRGAGCSAPRRTSSRSGRRACTFSPSAWCRCPRNGTG